jgi:DNA-binding NtrC family response regulator
MGDAMSGQKSVLIVDDDPPVVEALRRTLHREGYRLFVAYDAAQALSVLENESVDVLVSDLEMPEMNGLELLARVRAQWPEVVRIVLTGGGSLESAISAINQGEVHRYLTKPWSNDQLREMMRATMARLEALRGPARAQVLSRAQETLRRELDAQYPGILEVVRSDEVYVVDDDRLRTVLRALDEPGRARFQSAELAAMDDETRAALMG